MRAPLFELSIKPGIAADGVKAKTLNVVESGRYPQVDGSGGINVSISGELCLYGVR